jgi:hypothetical protein
MKKVLIPLLLLLCCSAIFAQSYKALVARADALYQGKDYAQSVSTYKDAFKMEEKNPTDLYNAGCSAALAGDSRLAFKWLNLALKNGWANVRHLKSDSDLTTLHDTRKWRKLVDAMQKEVDKREANYDKPLQTELLRILEDDQKGRQQIGDVEKKYGSKSPEMTALWKSIQEKDSINLIQVKAILDKYGWVGSDKVGGQANQTLFLVIQHSDLATQQKYLPMMREAVKNKKAAGSALALLEDRVALGEGRKQLYGSQINRDYDTGKSYVLPLEDPDNVDKRRASMGLGPLSDYVARWNITWDVEAYKKQLPEIEAKQKKNH